MLNRKGKVFFSLAIAGIATVILLGAWLYPWNLQRPTIPESHDITSAPLRVLQFLERAGWKPKAEKIAVEKVGENLGLARAVLLKKSSDGLSTPGMLFTVGSQYILVGRLFDAKTGRDLSPELFGTVPITFDVSRLNLTDAHKRGSLTPKVVIVEFGDYGCPNCAKLEKVWQPLLDNFPDVQRVYKHFPLSDGSRYLAEVAEAVAEFDPAKFWDIHQRFMSADKSDWNESETRRFAREQLQVLGISPHAIDKLITAGQPGKRVSRDQGEFPVARTPTLIVNGEVVVGVSDYGQLKQIVETKLMELRP